MTAKNGRKGSKLADFRPASVNANRHTQRGLGMLDRSMSEDGFLSPITVAADGEAIDGSARLETAATRFDKPPIIIESDGTQPVIHIRRDIPNARTPQAKRLAISANRVGQVDLDFDADVLAGLVEEIDLSQFWFPDELSGLLAGTAGYEPPEDPGAEIDRAEKLREKWQVESGQLWELGQHRLIVGDCTDRAVVERLMQGEKADAVVTDPPYGTNTDTGWLTALNVKRGKPANKSDNRLMGDDGSLDLSFLFEYDKWLVWGFPYIYSNKANGWLVWDKWPGVDGGGLGNPVEMALTNFWSGFRLARVMWAGYYRAEGEKREPHPTQKPLTVIEPFVQMVEGIVYDPFAGSGTTLIACERLGRKCRAVEISPAYCAVTLERWHALTGQPPRREEG